MAGVQFANILDFMMVNPLGPRLAEALDVPVSKLPIVIGSYTAAASVTGILGLWFLRSLRPAHRPRRHAVRALDWHGALGGLATGFNTLVLARIVAGMFGGPATSLSFAIVADTIPTHRRGWAMGIAKIGAASPSLPGVGSAGG